jgi:hypothetical protein
VSVSSFDEEMHRLDEGLKALQIEYNRYFTGALDRPPTELQTNLANIIRDHTNPPEGRRTAEQFRFSSLVSRYHIQIEMWNRNVRQIEEGRPSMMDRRESVAAPPQGKPAEKELFSTRVAAGDSAPENPQIHKLYKSYLSAANGGEGLTGAISYRSFFKQVDKSMERCQAKNGGKPVELKVVLVDNRPLLKLKSSS